MSLVLKLIGYASGIAGNNPDCALAPWYLFNHPKWFHHAGVNFLWQDFLRESSDMSGANVLPQVINSLRDLSLRVLALAKKKRCICRNWRRSFFCCRDVVCGCAC